MPEPAPFARRPPAAAAELKQPATAIRAAAGPAAQRLNARSDVRRLADLSERLSTRPAGPRPVQRRPVAQLKRIPVGFDRVAGSKAREDSIVTDGLGNCIAVAAQDKKTGAAVMGHFDTLNAYDVDTKKFDASVLEGFRNHLLGELATVAGGKADPIFQVSVGSVWLGAMSDIDSPERDNWWFMRHSLLTSCVRAFGTEPTQGGLKAEFFLASGTIKGSAELGREAGIVTGPDDDPHGRAGTEIPYAKIREHAKGKSSK